VVTVPKRQRAALVLRYLYDWLEDRIAEALGCRPSSVRSLISRGLATLRRSPSPAQEAHNTSRN
jgi:DNA-directed RNA polymerase specialized sigma24 family protein